MHKLLVIYLLLNSILVTGQQSSTKDSVSSLIQKYQYKQALEFINRSFVPQADEVTLLYFKGLAYKGLQMYPEAIYAFDKALRRDSSNFQMAWELANCYKTIGNYPLALKAFERADMLNPDNSQVSIEEAGIFMLLEQYHAALDIYFNLLQKDSLNIFLIRNVAKTYDNLEMTDSAGYFYDKAIKLFPNDLQSVFRLSNIYIKQEKFADATDITNNYRVFDKRNLKINRLNAYTYYLSEKYPTAITRFNACIQHDDTTAFTYKYLGLSYFRTERYDSAKVFLEKSFRKDSLNAQTCYALGLVAKMSGANQQSIDYLNKTLEIVRPSPKFESEVLQNLAESYNNVSLYQKALQSLLAAKRVTPVDTLLKFRIAIQYDDKLKNTKEALRYYKEFMKTRPAQKNKNLPKPAGLSYYDAVEKRMIQLRKEIQIKTH